MRDVALEAGVSLATVSYVLNDRSQAQRITLATKTRVLAAVERLSYKVHPIGRALQKGRTNQVILLIVTWDLAISHSATAMAISRAAFAQGYELTVHVADDDKLADEFLRRRTMHHLGGLMVLWDSTVMQTSPVVQLAAEGLPVIDLLPGTLPGVSTVTADREEAFSRATRYLVGLGHRHIGIICDAATRAKTSLRKLAGYQRALVEAGLAANDRWIENVEQFGFEGGHYGLRQLARRCPELTGLLCINDGIALGAIAALQDSGRKCPRDLSVIGFGDAAEGRYFHPSVSTFGLSSQRVADSAIAVLERTRIGEQLAATTVLVIEEFLPRESTGPAPGWSA